MYISPTAPIGVRLPERGLSTMRSPRERVARSQDAKPEDSVIVRAGNRAVPTRKAYGDFRPGIKQISVEITQRCPNRCLHCSSRSSIRCTTQIGTEKVKEIIDSAARLNTELLSISGGEPFLHEGLLEIVEYAKAKGLAVHMYTSGITLDDAEKACCIPEESLRGLQRIGVDKLIFDIPAIDESIYDKFMDTKEYQRFALASIHMAKRLGIHTEIHFVPSRINLGEIKSVLQFARETGVDGVNFLGLVSHGRAAQYKDKLVLSSEENQRLKD